MKGKLLSACVLTLLLAGTTLAQAQLPGETKSNEIILTGCASCGGSDLLSPSYGGGGGCVGCGGADGLGSCAAAPCYPGAKPCDCCIEPDNCFGKLFFGFYHCVCCPDPCYEPKWQPLADAAFFVEAPRPVTQMKLRYDRVWDHAFPDKSEYFMARSDGRGKGPRPVAGAVGTPTVSYRELWMINEAAVDRASITIAMPYRQLSSDDFGVGSGFGDLVIATKSLLLDCELMQFSFGFTTFIPTGNTGVGAGTGHVSLEPSIFWACKCSKESYHQGQLALRIPIGGDQDFQGTVFHYHLSYNHLLWCCGNEKAIELVGSLELNGYHFEGGRATDPRLPGVGGAQAGNVAVKNNIGDVISVGPGIRLVFCRTIDFGIGSAFAITDDNVGEEWARVEFRWRF